MDPLSIRNPVTASASPPIPSRPTPNDRSNALNIVDEFTPSPFAPVQLIPAPAGGPPIAVREAPHGTKVEQAARETGFPGQINQVQTQENPALFEQRGAEMALRFGPLEPAQARENLDRYVQNQSIALTTGARDELQAQTQAGTRQAVTNFSLGAGPAVATSNLYRQARMAWSDPEPGAPPLEEMQRQSSIQLTQNLAAALDVNAADLTHSDPAISGPARAQFQQRLVDFSARSVQSPPVPQAHQDYAQSVRNYEALGNSVVISAGNEGELLDLMRADNGGRAIQAPPDFYRSALSTSETTSVGALTFRDDRTPTVAPYSSGGDGVPVVAYARAMDGQPGTSFAAPRVGAFMQHLHQQNPTLNSSEVERLMLRMQTMPVEGTHALTL